MLRLVRELGLVTAAIDLVVTPEGDHVFLELNPSGQWAWLETGTGLPMTDALVRCLAPFSAARAKERAMIEPTPWNQHATQLFAKLEKDGLVKTPELADVFWDVPRHEYIDALYVHANDIPSWRPCPCPKRPEADEDWLARIYADDFLAVKIGEDGIPLCFNMRPSTVFGCSGCFRSAVAAVLDIGTGTGQFAALLTRLLRGKTAR